MEPSWQGRRVSVRRVIEGSDDAAPDGSPRLADVVGDLVGLDAQTAVIETRDARLVEVPLALVAAARLVPPSTADELALEAVAGRGVRSVDSEWLGGWLLRADHGFLRRANSVLPLRQLGMPLDEALSRARAWYAERGLPLRLAIPAEARRLLDAELGERGWPFDTEAYVMTARLDRLRVETSHPVVLDERPDDAWLARYRAGEGAADTERALLQRHDHVVFASVVAGASTVAVGRGVVDDGWLGVTAVEVAESSRRRGLASAIMDAMWRWGESQGASRSYLQVEVANVGAVTAYERLGYAVHHGYHYRQDPQTST